jgi:hypothetical protein
LKGFVPQAITNSWFNSGLFGLDDDRPEAVELSLVYKFRSVPEPHGQAAQSFLLKSETFSVLRRQLHTEAKKALAS